MKTRVFLKLKPKVASLGFNKIELQGVAVQIATNLNSESVTDQEIDAAIDAVIPYLGLSQTAASRVINASAKKAREDAEKEKAKTITQATDYPLKDVKTGAETPQIDLGKQNKDNIINVNIYVQDILRGKDEIENSNGLRELAPLAIELLNVHNGGDHRLYIEKQLIFKITGVDEH